MDDALQIYEYLPIYDPNPAHQQYIQFLWDSFAANYQAGQYTFAFIPFHMLYMSVVYSLMWKLKRLKSVEFRFALIGFRAEHRKQILNAEDIFSFSVLNESQIFNILLLLDFDNNSIGRFKASVKTRNQAAHPSGVITFTEQQALDRQITKMLQNLEAIQYGCPEMLRDLLYTFLESSWDNETNQYGNYQDEVNEAFIRQNLLSMADLKDIVAIDLHPLEEHSHFTDVTALYNALQDTQAELA